MKRAADRNESTKPTSVVVICIEKEEVKNTVPVSPDTRQVEIDESWVLVEKGKENSPEFRIITHDSDRPT